jgi:hypothetical protein
MRHGRHLAYNTHPTRKSRRAGDVCVAVREMTRARQLALALAAIFASLFAGCVGPPLDLGPTELPNAVEGARIWSSSTRTRQT